MKKYNEMPISIPDYVYIISNLIENLYTSSSYNPFTICYRLPESRDGRSVHSFKFKNLTLIYLMEKGIYRIVLYKKRLVPFLPERIIYQETENNSKYEKSFDVINFGSNSEKDSIIATLNLWLEESLHFNNCK